MTHAEILTRLADIGVTVAVKGDRLSLKPASAVPADLRAEIEANKAEIIAALSQPAPEHVSDVSKAPEVSEVSPHGFSRPMTHAEYGEFLARQRETQPKGKPIWRIVVDVATADLLENITYDSDGRPVHRSLDP